MYTDIGFAQLACVQIARLKETGQLTPVQVSLAMALEAARSARDLLSANGITLAHPPIRDRSTSRRSRRTRARTTSMRSVLGRHITGVDAFS
jgi:glutaryl-CoA dehydrogenase